METHQPFEFRLHSRLNLNLSMPRVNGIRFMNPFAKFRQIHSSNESPSHINTRFLEGEH
jgi:hypothetical protein